MSHLTVLPQPPIGERIAGLVTLAKSEREQGEALRVEAVVLRARADALRTEANALMQRAAVHNQAADALIEECFA